MSSKCDKRELTIRLRCGLPVYYVSTRKTPDDLHEVFVKYGLPEGAHGSGGFNDDDKLFVRHLLFETEMRGYCAVWMFELIE
jgi:hypothetical protein